jgi:hypothetical protein
MREYQVRICERLGVKFPGPTRHSQPKWVARAMSAIPPTATATATAACDAKSTSCRSIWRLIRHEIIVTVQVAHAALFVDA